jgi:hypothetical protein
MTCDTPLDKKIKSAFQIKRDEAVGIIFAKIKNGKTYLTNLLMNAFGKIGKIGKIGYNYTLVRQ